MFRNSNANIDNLPNIYGYDTLNFKLMPPNTNKRLIIEAMSSIVRENRANHITTSFSGSPENSLGLPYMELLIPDPAKQYYCVYSATNPSGNLFTTDPSLLKIENEETLQNGFRFYMWNATIFDLSVQPTKVFPNQKNFSFKNCGPNMVQKMILKAETIPNTAGPYIESRVIRNTIYIYYPSSFVYCLVDTNTWQIFVMQAGNNQLTGTTPLTPENMMYNQQLIASGLPTGFLFLSCQLTNDQTVLVVSSPRNPATLMQDAMGNTYQLADPYYGKVLYDNFITPNNA